MCFFISPSIFFDFAFYSVATKKDLFVENTTPRAQQSQAKSELFQQMVWGV
jgi:hypothetical protein